MSLPSRHVPSSHSVQFTDRRRALAVHLIEQRWSVTVAAHRSGLTEGQVHYACRLVGVKSREARGALTPMASRLLAVNAILQNLGVLSRRLDAMRRFEAARKRLRVLRAA